MKKILQSLLVVSGPCLLVGYSAAVWNSSDWIYSVMAASGFLAILAANAYTLSASSKLVFSNTELIKVKFPLFFSCLTFGFLLPLASFFLSFWSQMVKVSGVLSNVVLGIVLGLFVFSWFAIAHIYSVIYFLISAKKQSEIVPETESFLTKWSPEKSDAN